MIFALSSLSVILASLSLVSAAPHEHGLVRESNHGSAAHHHQKRFTGLATWYNVGLGACGDWNEPSDYIVALNSAQLDTRVYPPVQCGRKVLITYQGKSAVATVKDECSICGFGGLNMSKGLFQYFTDLGTDEFQMNWDWADNNEKKTTERTTRTTTKTSSSSSSASSTATPGSDDTTTQVNDTVSNIGNQ